MVLLACLWICWCLLHSLLISRRVQAALLPRSARRYFRLTYNIFGMMSLVPVLWYQYTLPARQLFSWSGPWRVVQMALLLYGAILFYLGARSYDIRYFLGLRQIAGYEKPPGAIFHHNGILNRVRHPWYSGGLALLWAHDAISDVSLLSRILLTVYLFAGTLLEERRLLEEIGAPYRWYQKEVPMFFPRLGGQAGSRKKP